ncbi:MAG: YihA family ribosome biogenesis GTP-binding protein [Rickettsiales bacterium]|nr:YihA family ribosome biogenesis GTP-binding protein [Rickettsiales bacterium]
MARDTHSEDTAARLFRGTCDFVMGVASLDGLPPLGLPEIAFVGRSNVGKSSLINALVGRKALARTSNTPGRTQQLNFFNLAGKMLMVDLPGYGYAKVSKKDRRDWEALIGGYLTSRRVLRRVLVLVDARRGLMESDLEFLAFLTEAGVAAQAILTKVDKCKLAEREQALASVQEAQSEFLALSPEIVVTSARKRDGIEALQSTIATLVTGEK